jgi:hypothetical protein
MEVDEGMDRGIIRGMGREIFLNDAFQLPTPFPAHPNGIGSEIGIDRWTEESIEDGWRDGLGDREME